MGVITMKGEITIRKITPQDKNVFIEMSREFYHSSAVLHEIDDNNHFAAFDELLRSDMYLEAFILEVSGKTAGYALLNKMYSREAGGTVVWVEELYVREKFRSCGAGRTFFKFLEENVPAARYRLELEPDNIRAKALYERMGYEVLPYEQMYKVISE